MKHAWLSTAVTAVMIAAPAFAQHGLGVGRGGGGFAGPPSGAVHNTVQGSLGQSAGPGAQGPHGLGPSAQGGLDVTQNPGLSAQLQPLLPAGTTLAGAAAGFQNQGQFVSALHVAHNLNIPFDQLKSQMTGSNAVSLGKAIHNLQPNLDNSTIKDNVKLADHQTARDVRQAESAGKPDRTASHLASNSQLVARITPLLPPGMTAEEAATGFKNQGQFLAALHVAHNLNISFLDLKDRMTAGQSLGAAIQALKPSMDTSATQAATVTAEDQAKDDQIQVSATASTSVGTK
jgi:hypothetical protein